jgi:hypothetical protein
LEEVPMQKRTDRLHHGQLDLFGSQAEPIDWHRLPREVQRKMMALLTRLLREHSETQRRRSVAKGSSYE